MHTAGACALRSPFGRRQAGSRSSSKKACRRASRAVERCAGLYTSSLLTCAGGQRGRAAGGGRRGEAQGQPGGLGRPGQKQAAVPTGVERMGREQSEEQQQEVQGREGSARHLAGAILLAPATPLPPPAARLTSSTASAGMRLENTLAQGCALI